MWFLWISHRLLGHLGVEDGMFLWNQWDFYHFENGNQWALFHEYAFPVMGNSWKFDLEKNEIGSFCGWESMWESRQESWWNQWTMARKTHWWHHWWRKATPLSPALVARVDFGPEKKTEVIGKLGSCSFTGSGHVLLSGFWKLVEKCDLTDHRELGLNWVLATWLVNGESSKRSVSMRVNSGPSLYSRKSWLFTTKKSPLLWAKVR